MIDTIRMHQKTCDQPVRPVVMTCLRWLCSSSASYHIPVACRDWLLDDSSLTAKLKKHALGVFRVQLICQEWRLPSVDESILLAQPYNRLTNIREVLLLCHDTPVVFARTVIPSSTLEGENAQLLHLKNKPLGEVIFSDPTLQRGPIEITKTVDTNNHPVWGRRSVFTLKNKPLVVSEFFLPTLFDRHSLVQPAGAISE